MGWYSVRWSCVKSNHKMLWSVWSPPYHPLCFSCCGNVEIRYHEGRSFTIPCWSGEGGAVRWRRKPRKGPGYRKMRRIKVTVRRTITVRTTVRRRLVSAPQFYFRPVVEPPALEEPAPPLDSTDEPDTGAQPSA